MNLPRIPFKQFLASRWFPWALVVTMATALGGSGWYGGVLVKERESYKRQVEAVREQYVRAVRETVNLREELRQVADTKKDTRKTIEEVRPDGTRILIKEETNEEVATTTDRATDSVTVIDEKEQRDVETVRETEEQEKVTTVRAGSQYRVGTGIVVRGLDGSPDIEVSGSRRVFGPFSGRVAVDIDGVTYRFEGARFSLEFEF